MDSSLIKLIVVIFYVFLDFCLGFSEISLRGFPEKLQEWKNETFLLKIDNRETYCEDTLFPFSCISRDFESWDVLNNTI